MSHDPECRATPAGASVAAWKRALHGTGSIVQRFEIDRDRQIVIAAAQDDAAQR